MEGRKGCFEGVDIAFKQHSAVEDEPMLGDSAKNRQFCSSQLARQLAQRLISPGACWLKRDSEALIVFVGNAPLPI